MLAIVKSIEPGSATEQATIACLAFLALSPIWMIPVFVAFAIAGSGCRSAFS
jgi:hypothetical protein